MSRPSVLNPTAKEVVRTCWLDRDASFTQIQLAEVLGVSRDVIARAVAGLSRTPRADRRKKEESNDRPN
jgi:DNA-binding transcriptional regulator LsrR (DeoR family)